MIALGLDIGSSSIKAATVDLSTGAILDQCALPRTEMKISAPKYGWAEQDPYLWWELVCQCTQELKSRAPYDWSSITSVGIAYQMHGLVMVDKDLNVLRPSIIWCDSRAVTLGDKAYNSIGKDYCHHHLLNSPGNFTASKLAWVRNEEVETYKKCYKIMLPGEFIAMKLTGAIRTSISGLSEGIFWDFKAHEVSKDLLEYYKIDRELLPKVGGSFDIHGSITEEASRLSGIPKGAKVSYKAGDQCNNAFSLNVMESGEIAATGGTSGVIYGIADHFISDANSRINTFAHVNYTLENPRLGALLCINGAGAQYAWIRRNFSQESSSYDALNQKASSIPVGSNGLCILPFGNGSERMLKNENKGALFANVQFNVHDSAHFYRAALEGIAFSFVYGARLLKKLGLEIQTIRVGNDNLFNAQIFSSTISNLLQTKIEVIGVNGAVGAARASGLGIGYYKSYQEAHKTLEVIKTYFPKNQYSDYEKAFQLWENHLNQNYH